jgi:hypothetical protein
MPARNDKWYFSISTLVVSFLCVGPFVLPLVWFNPNSSKNTKIYLSLAILIITVIFGFIFLKSLKAIDSYYQLLNA